MDYGQNVEFVDLTGEEASGSDGSGQEEEQGPAGGGDAQDRRRGRADGRRRYGHPDQRRPGVRRRNRKSECFFGTWQRTDKYRVYDRVQRLCQSICVSREYGCNNSGHLHGYIRTTRKWSLADLNAQLEAMRVRADDLQVCRKPKDCIKYVTKEDTKPCIRGVDFDQTHINFRMAYYNEHHEAVSAYDYIPRTVPHNYEAKFAEQHREYWAGVNTGIDLEEATIHGSQAVVTMIKESDKKGIWLWGQAGSGKSSSAYLACKQDYVEFCDSSNFPISAYSGQSDIVYDDATVDGYVKHRKLILQITSGYMFTFDVKGKNQKTARLRGKFICTSNYPPPDEEAFRRRFEIINLN